MNRQTDGIIFFGTNAYIKPQTIVPHRKSFFSSFHFHCLCNKSITSCCLVTQSSLPKICYFYCLFKTRVSLFILLLLLLSLFSSLPQICYFHCLLKIRVSLFLLLLLLLSLFFKTLMAVSFPSCF